MERVVVPELLDSDAGTKSEIAASLLDLRDLNRFLGGISLTAKLLTKIARKYSLGALNVADVAGGEGYVLARLAQRLQKRDIQIHGTILDRSAGHIAPPSNALRAVCGDALALPFADDSFDVVTSNLFLHHLEPADVLQFLREAARVARYAVVINDLDRHWLHWRLAQLGGLIYRSRITRHDAPASVRRAYTAGEMRDLLPSLGLPFSIERGYFYRLGICIWKQEASSRHE